MYTVIKRSFLSQRSQQMCPIQSGTSHYAHKCYCSTRFMIAVLSLSLSLECVDWMLSIPWWTLGSSGEHLWSALRAQASGSSSTALLRKTEESMRNLHQTHIHIETPEKHNYISNVCCVRDIPEKHKSQTQVETVIWLYEKHQFGLTEDRNTNNILYNVQYLCNIAMTF